MKFLQELDIVIISLHFGSHKDGEANTQRILKALKNPYATFLAHPTMRLMGERDPHPMDMEAIIQAAKETGTAMEINSSKMRLDLKDVHARRAHELGVVLAINTDSHAVDQFNQMRLGIGTARRGWVTSSGVLNTWPLEKIKEFRRAKFQKLGYL